MKKMGGNDNNDTSTNSKRRSFEESRIEDRLASSLEEQCTTAATRNGGGSKATLKNTYNHKSASLSVDDPSFMKEELERLQRIISEQANEISQLRNLQQRQQQQRPQSSSSNNSMELDINVDVSGTDFSLNDRIQSEYSNATSNSSGNRIYDSTQESSSNEKMDVLTPLANSKVSTAAVQRSGSRYTPVKQERYSLDNASRFSFSEGDVGKLLRKNVR